MSSSSPSREDEFISLMKKYLKTRKPAHIVGFLATTNFDATTYKSIAETLLDTTITYLSIQRGEKSQRERAEDLHSSEEVKCFKLIDEIKSDNQKIGDLKLALEVSRNETTKYEILLDARCFIEWVERECFPEWLLQAKHISRYWKWMIALEFELTQTLSVIRERIKFHELIPSLVARVVKEAYGEISESTIHKYPDLNETSDREWAILFDHLRIEDEDSKKALKSVLIPVKKVPKEIQEKHESKSDTKDYVLETVFSWPDIDGTKLGTLLKPYEEYCKGHIIQKDGSAILSVFFLFRNVTDLKITEVVQFLQTCKYRAKKVITKITDV